MKNQKGSAAFWILLILAVVIVAGAAYWYATQNQAQPAVSATSELQTQQATQNNQITQTQPSMATYTDAQYGFSMQYPNALPAVTDPGSMTTQSYFGSTFVPGFTPLVQFKIKEQFGSTSNDTIEGDLQVSVATTPALVSACLSSYPNNGDLVVKHQGMVNINGTSFSEIDGADSATSNEFGLYSYSTVRNGACYKIEIVEQGSAYNPSDAVTIVNGFMPAIQSFKFTS